MKLCLFSFLFLFSYFLSANAQEIDSLLSLLAKSTADTTDYELNLDIGYVILNNNPDSARNYFINSLELANKLNDNFKIARSSTLIGVTYYVNGQFDHAMEYYLKALPISETEGNERYSGIISNNIGAVYFEMEDYESTKPYYEKAIGYFKTAKDTFWLSNSLNNLANLYEKQEKHSLAIEVYLESLKLAKKSGNREAIGSTVSNLGNVYMAMEKFDEALIQYHQGVQIQKEVGDKIGEAITYNNIGQIYAKKKKFTEAVIEHKKAIALAKEIKHPETLKNAYQWLAQVYSSMGQYKEAYNFHADFIVLKDSLTGIEKTNAVQEIEKKYQSVQRKKEIAELEIKNQQVVLGARENANQRNILIFVLAIISIVVGFLVFFNFSKQKALGEKETLLKEIHHRVKNNLQVISSLLNLQADSLDNEAASDAVKEGQHRVTSMALIHQKLYSTDDVRGVDIQDYLETLVHQLFEAFGLDNEKVVYKIETTGLVLDIDTVIPLGLIVNELITNAIKYAFQDAEKGELHIQLKETGDQLFVQVKDNGAGMDHNEMQKANSFGWKMIKSLSRKLKAEINVINDAGTTVELTLSRYKLVV